MKFTAFDHADTMTTQNSTNTAGANVTAGQPNPATATGTLTMLTRAAQGCLNGTFSAMVTAPVAKNVICEGADPAFTGHTEFLAEQASDT